MSLFTPDPLRDRSAIQVVARLLADLPEGLRPERFGPLEPRKPFDPDLFVETWDGQMFWKAKHVFGSCYWRLSSEPFSRLGFRVGGVERERVVALTSFVEGCIRAVGASFGLIHSVTPFDVERGRRSGTYHPGGNDLVIPTQTFERFLPDVYWLTVFGPPYIDFLGRERLLAAPVADVRELSADVIALQLTEDLAAALEDPDGFEHVREQVKRHLGEEAFFDPSRQVFRVPRELLPTEPATTPSVETRPDELLAAKMNEMAEAFASVGREQGYTLDYTEESVELLDHLISDVFGDPADESGRAHNSFYANMTPTIGAYLGSVMVRQLNGYWAYSDHKPCVVLNEFWTHPITKVQKRFLNGWEDSVAFFYRSLKQLAASSALQ
jgi:hypothetical protein